MTEQTPEQIEQRKIREIELNKLIKKIKFNKIPQNRKYSHTRSGKTKIG